MRNEEIKAELSALRAEVLALAEARKQSELRAVRQPEAPSAAQEHDEVEAEHDGFMGQVKELVELLEEEPKYYQEIAEHLSQYEFQAVARAMGRLHAEEKLWQDERGRACVRGSAHAAKAPTAN